MFAGGFSLEDHLFKGLAFGHPFVKAIGMARAPLTAAMASAAVWRRINEESDEMLISRYGREKDEIFFGANMARKLVDGRFEELSAGGLGVFTYFMRIEQGLKQLMAGARKFNLADPACAPSRRDLAALTKQAAEITAVPYIMDHDRREAEEILAAV